MIKRIAFTLLLTLAIASANAQLTDVRNGDIIFQTSLSKQSMAIQIATHSKYSHCGIIVKNNGEWFVFEAVQPVKLTPLDQWVARGDGGHYVIKRLKNAANTFTPAIEAKMKAEGEKLMSKNYDLAFDWSDDKIYCSELIWKVYQRATGLEVGKLQKLKDMDLSNPLVKQKLIERYGDNIPLEQTVITPAAIFESELLTTIASN